MTPGFLKVVYIEIWRFYELIEKIVQTKVPKLNLQDLNINHFSNFNINNFDLFPREHTSMSQPITSMESISIISGYTCFNLETRDSGVYNTSDDISMAPMNETTRSSDQSK